MLCPNCHKPRVVEIAVTIGDHRVTMHSCSACTARWWDKDGVQLRLPDVLELATAHR